MPAQLLLQAAAAEQADPYHAIGAGLYPACIDFRPAFLRQPSVVHRPLADLCLFSSLQSATNVLPFTVLATGRDVFTLQAYSDWSLAAFFHTAVGVVSELPQAVQLLTTGLPGLAEPQFVLTTAGAPCLAVPLDLREFGGNVVVVNPAPSTSLEDLLQGELDLAEDDVLQDHLLRRDLFLQDARGGMQTAVPEDAADLQWLRLRSRTPARISSLWPNPGGDAQRSSTSTTTTTTTAVLGGETTVRFTLTGAGMTLTTAPMPVQQFDVVQELATLIIAMTRAGRLPQDAHVLMAATWPLPQEDRHFNIPLLVYQPGEFRHVVFDPSFVGSQIHSMVAQAETLPEQILSPNQEGLGFVAWVNGAPQSAVRRSLRTGDFIQLHPGDTRVRYPVGHPSQLFGHVNRLHCLSAPMRIPTFDTAAVRTAQAGTNAEARQGLLSSLDRALRARVELLGLPDRTRQKVVLLEPGRAPHVLWLDLRTCPTVEEAEPHIRALRILPDDARIPSGSDKLKTVVIVKNKLFR